ncbi:ribosome maturation factor RimM [Larkinella punicea]|uniref:Ribosome maturation factor RimM n=1 Tax=Larkinella punicea TaxID=2315727 RepID=A0A368JWF5_9BACT|nr:ribosome maturation factor RimM [Larkinella punicea]RCR70923.1 16S rRNA processing protein RimM [Larkinella punicea]
MTKDDCFQLGKITKTHGVRGELVFFLDVDMPELYAEMDSVLIEVKGDLVPYFIESISVNRNRGIVALEGVETIEEAQKLVNCDLFLPLDNLDELDEGQFYFHEIVGFLVRDEKLGDLGTVRTVYNVAPQNLISMDYQGKEVLIPVNDELTPSADKVHKILHVRLPDGLVDIYLEEPSAKIGKRTEADDEEESLDED